MISSRQIERACHENIIFIALSYGYAPDHTTIASFISSMQSEISSIFSDILVVCEELKLLGGTHFSLDGVKLSANVSKEWSGTIDELKHKRDKLQEKLQRVIAEHAQADKHPQVEIERQKKRERRFQVQVERLNDFLKDREPKLGSEGKEIQSNAMDNESAKMTSSHGVLQGYNAQALVDSKHQIILAAEAFASQDHENLKPMLDSAKKNLVTIGKRPDYFESKELTADSNYHSLNSLKVCKDEKLDAYIPDIQFRKRDPRFAQQERFKEESKKPRPFSAVDFTYDESKRVYRCPNGKELKCHARGQVNRYRTYDVYHARTEDCAACPLRSRCLSKSDASRRYLSIQVDTGEPNLIDEMKAKIDSQQGKKIYARRLGIVEPVFANICVHKHMDHFTLRSNLEPLTIGILLSEEINASHLLKVDDGLIISDRSNCMPKDCAFSIWDILEQDSLALTVSNSTLQLAISLKSFRTPEAANSNAEKTMRENGGQPGIQMLEIPVETLPEQN